MLILLGFDHINLNLITQKWLHWPPFHCCGVKKLKKIGAMSSVFFGRLKRDRLLAYALTSAISIILSTHTWEHLSFGTTIKIKGNRRKKPRLKRLFELALKDAYHAIYSVDKHARQRNISPRPCLAQAP